MTNKKFYIFLFIDIFLLKIYPGCLCRKKKPESNLYFKDGSFPAIKLRFKKPIDPDDIYYDIYLYIEKDGKQNRDSFVFYYGIPDENECLTFSPNIDFLDSFKKKDKLLDRYEKYQINQDYLEMDLYKSADTTLKDKYYSNCCPYWGNHYYYFVDENKNDRMYKKLIPDDEKFLQKYLENTTFTIEKLEEKLKKKNDERKINEIKITGKNLDNTSCDYRILTEFYIKNNKQTITVEFYRSKVQSTEYYTFSYEVKLNGTTVKKEKNIINNNNNDNDKINTVTIDNK